MSIFQKSVLNNASQDESKVALRWAEYQKYLSKIEFIKTVKEEKYQDGFLKDIFENCLGYTLDSTNPDDFNLEREKKNETDGKKADGVIYVNNEVIGIIELKAQDTKNLDKIEAQAFNYHNSHSNSKYIIISNFDELRLYIDKKTAYEKFSLFNLNYEEFKKLHLLLSYESIKENIPQKLKDKSASFEQDISKNLYKDFSAFRIHLFENLVKNNLLDKALLLRLTQKLCDRIIFILFAEDRGLLTANTIKEIRERHQSDGFGDRSMYDYFKLYFDAINKGNERLNIPKYNGGLFAVDETLDSLIIDDNVLDLEAQALSDYDFMSDVSVNILGHIFEQSLTDLEEINASINDTEFDNKQSKRKKDGVFYTPEYITKYIVDNTLGKLCNDKREELNLTELTAPKNPKKPTKKEQITKDNLEEYLNWLLNIKILDPACGSGAFLNQALDFLISEHNALQKDLVVMGDLTAYYEVEKSILENNLYGVDINEDAVEIAKLSLWLRTASKGRELTKLADKIKCGNSLIDDKNIVDNAFVWNEEFSEVFEDGGFDVVIGNPPYLGGREWKNKETENYFISKYQVAEYQFDMYVLFWELGVNLMSNDGLLSFITPNTWLNNQSNTKLRELILENTSITDIVDYSKIEVFDDATVLTIIATLKKGTSNGNTQVFQPINDELIEINSINQNIWLQNDHHIININLSEQDNILLKKIEAVSSELESIAKIKFGVKLYEKGKGKPKQESLFSKENIYESNVKIDDSYRKYLTGKDINKYSYYWNNTWVKYGENLAAPRERELFKNKRIVVRRIVGDRLISMSLSEDYVTSQLLQIVKLHNEELTNVVTAILNSSLMIYFFKTKYNRQEKTFPEIRIYELASLPIIKNINPNIQLSAKVEFMIQLNKNLEEAKLNFMSELEIEKIPKKLQNFEELDFDEFIKEYKKAKRLKFADKLEERNFKNDWKALFENDRNIALDLKSQIDITDKEIDEMVYKLYGLSDDEIKIIENLYGCKY